MPDDEDHDDNSVSETCEVLSPFKGIDKALYGYSFLRSGHVQNIDIALDGSLTYARSNLLPSMKKSAPSRLLSCGIMPIWQRKIIYSS